MFDFGNSKLDFKLYANLGINKWFRKTVMCSGNWCRGNGRSNGLVEFEIPCQVESRELCAAFLAYYLRSWRVQDDRSPGQELGWLIEGQRNQDLLPWRAKQAAYEARPQCTVERDWLRLALKTLAGHLGTVGDDAPVVVGFENGVLSIQCAGKAIALPGEGLSWPQRVTIPAGQLRHLPKRFMRQVISVSVWESRLCIDRWYYAGESTDSVEKGG